MVNGPRWILQDLLRNHFKGLVLRSPLFYNAQFGIRFDLQTCSNADEEYFRAGLSRAQAIFWKVFAPEDNAIVFVQEYKYKPRQRLKKNSFVFKKLKTTKAQYGKVKNLYEENQIHNSFVGQIDLGKSDIINVLREIQDRDFYYRRKTRNRSGSTFAVEVYFINVERRIIFYMYDDRGVDVIASKMEDLVELYRELNDWILDYDRKEIDEKVRTTGSKSNGVTAHQ